MNARFILLTASLVANIALGALVYARRAPANAATANQARPVQSTSATAGSAPTMIVATKPTASAASSADLDYVARLRAGGMPADLIRELVYARVQARYRERMRALIPPAPDQYWRSGNQGPRADVTPEMRAQARELNKEMDAEIRALLGDGPDALGPYERRLYDQMASYLPAAKIQQLEAIRKDYDDLAARVREQGRGLILKTDREQLRLIESERRADLAAALSPDELLEYDLRASASATNLRNRLNYFEPTEDEFRAIAQLQLALDQQFGMVALSGEEQDRRKAAEKEFPAKVQAVLPPDRYADYLVSIDGMFSETRYFTSAYDLDPSVAKEIVALKQRTWKSIDELDRAGVTGDQRDAALKALEQAAENQLTARLGPDIFAKYKKSGAGWMNRLRPAPPPRS